MKWLLILAVMASTEARATEVECLARMMYSEARGESAEGQYAVGYTVINRMRKLKKDACWVTRHGYTQRRIPTTEVRAFLQKARMVLQHEVPSPLAGEDSFDSKKGRHSKQCRKIGKHYFREKIHAVAR